MHETEALQRRSCLYMHNSAASALFALPGIGVCVLDGALHSLVHKCSHIMEPVPCQCT